MLRNIENKFLKLKRINYVRKKYPLDYNSRNFYIGLYFEIAIYILKIICRRYISHNIEECYTYVFLSRTNVLRNVVHLRMSVYLVYASTPNVICHYYLYLFIHVSIHMKSKVNVGTS